MKQPALEVNSDFKGIFAKILKAEEDGYVSLD